jgi:hypothetical protein
MCRFIRRKASQAFILPRPAAALYCRAGIQSSHNKVSTSRYNGNQRLGNDSRSGVFGVLRFWGWRGQGKRLVSGTRRRLVSGI